MMTTTGSTFITRIVAFGILALVAFAFVIVPGMASAETYGYVDTAGEVKIVTAADWMTAIATAPMINIHSGVMLLMTAADYAVVGNDIVGAQ